MKVLQIGKAGKGKPNIWIEAGIHAREWIADAMGTFLIQKLLHDPAAKHLIDNLNVHVIPTANPDGYEYSRSTDRMWRKTRSDNNGHACKGVDPNRNWDFYFGGA